MTFSNLFNRIHVNLNDIAVFTFVAESSGYSLKTTNGANGLLAKMRSSNGISGADVVLKRTDGGSGILINTSGI